MKKKCIKRLRRNEGGQSLVEFALVLPMFLAILMGIIDFGWLFYNQIGVENAARNAARIACVEYTDTNTGRDEDFARKLKVPTAVTYDYNLMNIEINNQDEIDIVKAVHDSLPSSTTLQSVTISYSVDQEFAGNLDYYSANQDGNRRNLTGTLRRADGDVTVKVEAKMRVLTPILGVFSDHMMRTIKTESTYKVERMSDSDPADELTP